MINKKRIRVLLQHFIDETISASELTELSKLIEDKHFDNETKAWLYQIWNESSGSSGDYQSNDLFKKVKAELQISPKNIFEDKAKLDQKYSTSSRTRLLVKTVFKYAAVAVVAFTVAGWYFTQSNIEEPFNTKRSAVNEIEIPKGSKTSLTLSDGTRIWLNSQSKLIYPTSFHKGKREVFIEGEAYFDVSEDTLHPFIVNTDKIAIRVLGTEFNVKSYPDDDRIETTLVSGSIVIEEKESSALNRKNILKLNPNEQAVFIRSERQLTLLEKITKQKPLLQPKIDVKDSISTDDLISWKDNKLVFRREKFSKVITRLERWYGVSIILEYEGIKQFTYSGSFQDETIEQALNALRITTPFEYTMNKNKITISKPKK